MFLTDQERVLALISVTDQVKHSSKAAIDALHQLGINVKMLTGIILRQLVLLEPRLDFKSLILSLRFYLKTKHRL